MAGGTLSGGNGRRIISEINVTPLVDIMLVLLIIFMVTATYIVRQSLEVKLPEAATAEPTKVTLIAVTVDAAGRLGLNGERSSEAAVRALIRRQRAARASLEAVIAADRTVQHGRVVELIDLLRQEGVTKLAINVLKREARDK